MTERKFYCILEILPELRDNVRKQLNPEHFCDNIGKSNVNEPDWSDDPRMRIIK